MSILFLDSNWVSINNKSHNCTALLTCLYCQYWKGNRRLPHGTFCKTQSRWQLLFHCLFRAVLSRFSCVQLFATVRTVACQAPLSMLALLLLTLKVLDSPSLVAQMAKNLPVMQETQVQSLGQEDPLEKGIATHSSILAWRIPWTEEPGGLQCMGLQTVEHNWATKHSTAQHNIQT